mgnify:CR=1 FL=1
MGVKFLCDIDLEAANDVQFKTTAGAAAGKIEQDGNDLVLSNAVGDILLGDGDADVYIGDGTNNVDVLFEQSGSIKAEDGSSGVTLTLGSSDTTLVLGSSISSATTVGVNDTGYDVTFYGATSGKKMLWDESADTLVVDGTLDVNGDATVFTGAGSGSLTVGRNANESVVIYVDDSNTTITGVQDSDTNGAHSFILNRTFLGSGANNFIIQKGGTAQLTLDTSANATFAGTISSGAITSTGHIKAQNGGNIYVYDDDDDTKIHIHATSNATEGVLKVTNGSNYGLIVRGVANNPRLGTYHTGTLNLYGFGDSMGADDANDDLLAQFDFANEKFLVNGAITSTGAVQASSYKVGGVSVLQGSADITVGSGGATGTISLTTHTSTPFKIENDDSITINSNVTAGSNSLTAGSLDINGNADISGNLNLTGSITNATWGGDVIASNKLDSDTAHLSTTQTFTGTKTFDRLYESYNGTPITQLGTPSVRDVGLFDSMYSCKTDASNSYNDLTDLVFYKQDADGDAWDTITVSDDEKRRFLRGAGSGVITSNIVIPHGTFKYRVEFHAKGYTAVGQFYLYSSYNGNPFKLHMWAQRTDTDAWEQKTSSDANVAGWPGHTVLPFSTIWFQEGVSSSTKYDYIRLEFTPSWDHASNDINIYHGSLWGGYPAGRRTQHYYDQNDKIFLPGDANIVGDLTLPGVVRNTNNSNADGANFNVNTTNKSVSEYAYEVLRSGSTVAGIQVGGKIVGTELDINGAADISGTLSSGAITSTGNIRLPSSGKLYTWTGHDLNFLDYDNWEASASGGMTINNVASTGEIYLKSGNALALTLDENQAATFASTIDSGAITSTGKITNAIASTHVSGDISAANAHLDLYNNWESNTDQKGSIITFTDNFYSGSGYNKTTRAAIKGGTDTVGNTADGYLEFYTDSGGANSPTLALRLDKDQNAAFAGDVDISGTLDVAGDTTITNGLHVHHDEGIEIGDTGNNSTAKTTLTSDTAAGNSQMEIKGGNYVHRTAFQTSWNSFEYAKLESSYNTSDSKLFLNKSASDGSVASTTTISTGTSTFAGAITSTGKIQGTELEGTSLDINGAADISGNLVIGGTVDGIDIATRDAILTSTTTTAGAALPKAGGTMSGAIAMGNQNITGANNITAGVHYVGNTSNYLDIATGLRLRSDSNGIRLMPNGTDVGYIKNTGIDLVKPLTVGVDDTGHDVKFFGATAGHYTLWDESADLLQVAGDLQIKNPHGSNPADGGSLVFNEAGTAWGSDIYGFRLNLEGSSNLLQFQSANNSTVSTILTMQRDSLTSTFGGAIAMGGNNITGAGTIGSGPITSTSTIIADTYFASSDAAVVLAPASAGTCYLRPNGIGSGTGAFSISATGKATVGGALEAASLDINGAADISGNLTGVDTLTATTLSVTNYGLASGDIPNNAADTTGNAATVTTNANLTGHITSSGNAAVLGSFTVAQLSTALSNASISGNNTGDQTTITGNAGTATLAAAATTVTVADESSDTTCFPLFATAATGDLPPKSGSNLKFNSSDGILEATNLTATVQVTAKRYNITLSGGGAGTVGGAEVVYWGTNSTTTAGKIYYYDGNGAWVIANATSATHSKGLLAVAMGTASATDGMCLKGCVTLNHDPGNIGDVLYLNTAATGQAINTVSSTQNHVVRVIGYQISHASAGKIYFNPDSTFVEIA